MQYLIINVINIVVFPQTFIQTERQHKQAKLKKKEKRKTNQK